MTAYDRPTIGQFQAAIGMLSPLLSVCDRLQSACVRSPHTPRAIEAPSRAHSTRLLPPSAEATGRQNPQMADHQPGRYSEREGWNRPRCTLMRVDIQQLAFQTIAARTPSSLAGESRDSFAGIGRTKTAGSAQTHQRTRQAVCGPCPNTPAVTAFAHTVPTHRNGAGGKARNAAIFGIWPHDGKSREGDLHARAILLVPTLEVRKACARGRARGPGCRRNVEPGEKRVDRLSKHRGRGGWGHLFPACRYFDLSIQHSAALSKIWAAFIPKTLNGLHFLAAAGSQNPGLP
jgi:hypothetical protein